MAALLTLAWLGGCDKRFDINPSFSWGTWGNQSPAVSVGAQGEMVHLTDRTPMGNDPAIYDDRARAVKLFAAANETISLQVMVEPGQTPAANLRFVPGDLIGPGGAKIEAAGVAAFRMMPVKVTQYPPWYLRLVNAIPEPVNFYDALIPLSAPGKGSLAIPAGERLALWVDITVGRTVPAGEYKGQVRLTADGRKDATIDLSLKVYDFVLPDERPLAAVGAFDYPALFGKFIRRDGKPYVPAALDRSNNPEVMKGLVLMRQMMVLAHQHRLDLFDRAIHPVIKRDMAGRVLLDWEDYDAIVLPYLDGSAFEDHIGCGAWPMPFSDAWPDPRNYAGPDSQDYSGTLLAVAAECRQHLGKNLPYASQLFVWPYRGPIEQDAYGRAVKLSRIVRMADQVTPILSQLPPNPPALTGWNVSDEFRRLTDIVAPPAQWLDVSKAASSRRDGQRLAGAWLSPGTPPYLPSLGVIATPADVRSIPWFAMKYNCAGLFLPEVLHWQGDPDGHSVFATAAEAQTRLFYPGSEVGVDAVLPSVRLKRLRRGLQDLSYLWLLRQHERPGVAAAIVNSLVRYAGLEAAGDNYLDPRLGGWVHEGDAYEAARRLMAEEIQVLVHPTGEMSNQALLAQRLAWQQFEQSTHSVRVEQIRSRVLPMAGANRFRATVTLELYNEHGRDVDVMVKFEGLPEGWQAKVPQVHLGPLAANARQTVELSAEGSYVPASPSAKLLLPLSLTEDLQRRRTLSAAVPFLLAGSVPRGPTIDGKLDDWPMREGNTAGNFKLIGARGESDKPFARRGTLAFVTHDRDNLYIAFRCEEPRVEGLKAMSSNIIHYEQLMACGEDLVEVVLDPGCAAKGPEDLYHIAVKANGVLLTERGVHADPPLGVASAWPVAASVAVAKQDKLWVVELAIPLSAFGPAGKESFWGVNFTRFATQGSEASSWSEAGRYFYDPKNLGTMFMVPEKKP